MLRLRTIRARALPSLGRGAAVTLAGLVGLGMAVPLAAGTAQHEDARRTTVRVTERDFWIQAPRSLPSGRVTLRVHNAGPDDHELVVVHDDGVTLPIRADGLTVDEDRIADRTVGAVEPSPPYDSQVLRVKLPPGRYELFCNMSGHYLGGMHRRFTVR